MFSFPSTCASMKYVIHTSSRHTFRFFNGLCRSKLSLFFPFSTPTRADPFFFRVLIGRVPLTRVPPFFFFSEPSERPFFSVPRRRGLARSCSMALSSRASRRRESADQVPSPPASRSTSLTRSRFRRPRRGFLQTRCCCPARLLFSTAFLPRRRRFFFVFSSGGQDTLFAAARPFFSLPEAFLAFLSPCGLFFAISFECRAATPILIRRCRGPFFSYDLETFFFSSPVGRSSDKVPAPLM